MRSSAQTVLLVLLSISLAASAEAVPVMPADPIHAWVGLKDTATLENWVQWHIAEERRLVAAMLAIKGARTVENTLDPYDRAQEHLTLAYAQDGNMFRVNPEKAIRDKAQALQRVVSAEETSLSLNQDIYRALAALDAGQADAATKYYLNLSLLQYRLGGVDKDQATRNKVRQLQDRMTQISLKFSRNINDEVGKIVFTDPAELNGLPADYIARHKPAEDGAITLTTDSPDYTPVMSYAKSPELRRKMFLAYTNCGYPANAAVLKDLLAVRHELAITLGFTGWPDYATADKMIGSSAQIKLLLDQVDLASRVRAQHEFDLLRNFVRVKDFGSLPITNSDAAYWNEEYRRSAYAFDSQSVRPYFPYAQVEAGILKTASRLFHIEFRTAPDAPVWDPSVHAYDVYDAGQKAGRIYLDMHPREGKDKWFSSGTLVRGRKGEVLPETTLVCNFPGGTAGDPGLMQFDEVVTFFHEFGHMMHAVLGGRQRWEEQSGVATERDFVEAPSQMLEEMFHDPVILQGFAKDYKTGQTIPLDLISRMNRASYFGRARWVQQQLLYSYFALQIHDTSPENVDLDAILKSDVTRFNPNVFVEGNHFYASFTHLTNYSSNYYTYVLDKVIAVDFFSAFDTRNLLDGPTALRYRKLVLEPGGSKPAAQLVSDFLGRPQSVDSLKTWMDKEFEPAPAITR